MIYIASPYTHPKAEVREERYQSALRYTLALMSDGLACFSPIVYGHQFAVNHGLPGDFAFWQTINRRILAASTELHVLQLWGWQDSRGVYDELALAFHLNLPVRYV